MDVDVNRKDLLSFVKQIKKCNAHVTSNGTIGDISQKIPSILMRLLDR
jgi:hypothetical protein